MLESSSTPIEDICRAARFAASTVHIPAGPHNLTFVGATVEVVLGSIPGQNNYDRKMNPCRALLIFYTSRKSLFIRWLQPTNIPAVDKNRHHS